MIFLALSSLQGRPQQHAFSELAKLGPDGIQMAPGNLVSPGFEQMVLESGVPHHLHHGFSWNRYRRPVYDAEFNPIDISASHSIHSPKRNEMNGDFSSWLERMGETILEGMYPEYWLGNGKELELAMEMRKRLAIDISHLWIQKCQGVIEENTIKRVLGYDRICEVHVSQNGGRFDSHKPIDQNTPWLGWAKEKEKSGTLLVLEAYFHKLNEDQRKEQLEMMR